MKRRGGKQGTFLLLRPLGVCSGLLSSFHPTTLYTAHTSLSARSRMYVSCEADPWLAPQGTDALVSRWARYLPAFVVRSFHETSHELSSLLYLAPFRIFTATPHRTHHGSPTTGSGFWHRAHRLVSRHPPSALRRTLALTPSPRAPRSQGFVMPPTGAVAVRSSALSTESPVMLFGAKKPAPKKVAKRPVKKARSLVKEVAGHSSLRHTPGASPINASALAGWLPRLGALACSHAVSSA